MQENSILYGALLFFECYMHKRKSIPYGTVFDSSANKQETSGLFLVNKWYVMLLIPDGKPWIGNWLKRKGWFRRT